jgi:hypothetical protein
MQMQCNASHASMQVQAIRLTAMQMTCSMQMQVMVYYWLGLPWLTAM